MIETIACGSTLIALTRLQPSGMRSAADEHRSQATSLLRKLLGDDTAVMDHDEHGAPLVAGRPEVHISVSHSRTIVAVAVDFKRGVGIDIEENRARQLARVAPRVLSEAELAYYSARPGGLLEAWTMKEALFKLAPAGTADDFRRDICLPLVPGDDTARAGDMAAVIALSIGCSGYRLTLAAASEQ